MTDQTGVRWHRDPRVLWRRSGVGLVLLPPEAKECVVASGSTWPVWHHLAEPISEQELRATLSAEFDVDEDAIAHDVGPFLEALRGCGAILQEQR